jgi:hypothetical protein
MFSKKSRKQEYSNETSEYMYDSRVYQYIFMVEERHPKTTIIFFSENFNFNFTFDHVHLFFFFYFVFFLFLLIEY